MTNENNNKKPQQTVREKSPVRSPGADGLSHVTHRNEFYREGSGKLFIAAVIVIVGLIAQSVIAMMGFTAKNERVYFATDENGSLIELIVLGEPNQKSEVVAQWVQSGLVDVFSFNFTNLENRLNETTMHWFTKGGASSFLSEISSAGYMEVVRNEKMILSATLDHTPVLVKEGQNPATGIYSWMFQADATITFRTQSREFSRKVRFTIIAERRSVLEHVDGLGIASIVMRNI